MISSDIENLINVISRNRPKHHDLWDDTKIHCSPAKLERLTKLKEKGVENYSIADIDFLTFTSSDSLGSDQTFHYFLPDFFRFFFDKRGMGYTTDVEHIFRKLEKCNYESWPKESQRAALELCLKGAELEQEEHVDFFDQADEKIAKLIENIRNKLT